MPEKQCDNDWCKSHRGVGFDWNRYYQDHRDCPCACHDPYVEAATANPERLHDGRGCMIYRRGA